MQGRARNDDGPGARSRLDPVRWRPPGRATLLRLAAVAALLGTAAVVVWTSPPDCPAGRSATSACPPARTAPTTDDPPPAHPETAGPETPGPETPGPGADGAARRAVPSGMVGVPVALADQVAVRLVRTGDRVDLFAVDSPGASPTPVAQDAVVLAVTGTDEAGGGLLVALPPAGARRARDTPHRSGFEVTVRSG